MYVWNRPELSPASSLTRVTRLIHPSEGNFSGRTITSKRREKILKAMRTSSCKGWRVSPIEKRRRAKVRRGENQRRRDSLKIPKSLPKCDHCIFYRARGIANGFFGPPCIKSLRAFYRPVAAGVTPADLDFFSFLLRNVLSARPKIFRLYSLICYLFSD